VLLREVTAFRLRFYADGRWQETWDRPQTLPQGLEITLTLANSGEITRLFLLTPEAASENRQRGVALLMVLFILALMMILASAMTERTAVMYQHTAVTLDNLQARWYALAAENMAAALLQRDALDSPSQTNLAQTWAQEGRRFTLDDGEIRATIRDGHACFNLNAINHRADEASGGTPYPTDVFVRLLALLGESPLRASQIAAALGDWTDSDGQPRLNGRRTRSIWRKPGLSRRQPADAGCQRAAPAGRYGRRALSAPAPLRLRPAG
jgi:hypothetical protein